VQRPLDSASMAAEPSEGKKDKKPRPIPSPPPAPLATASLLVRGAAARVLGLRPGPAGGDLQPLWNAEPGNAKVTINIEGSSRSPFPKESQHSALIDAIEAATNELVQANAEISVFEMDKAAAEAKYGDAIHDGQSSIGNGKLRLAYVPGAALVEIPNNWSVCATTGAAGLVTFTQKEVGPDSKKKPDTMILLKRKQLMIRYEVSKKDTTSLSTGGDAPPSAEVVKELDSAAVRVVVPGVDTPSGSPSCQDTSSSSGGVSVAMAPSLSRDELVSSVARYMRRRKAFMFGAPEPPVAAGAAPSSSTAPIAENTANNTDMEVNPWEVSGRIDYGKLISKFGSTEISAELLARIEKLTVGRGTVPEIHPWLRRGIFFSHRDLDQICTCVEQGKPFYLYTGRGPSSASLHLGHLIPFMMTKWLQEAFRVPLVIQMTDDEKFLWKGSWDPENGDDLMKYRGLTTENAKDIIACGFNKDMTFIFSDLEYIGHMYPNIVRIWKAITYNTARASFGFQGDSNIGQSAFPAVQAAPSFPSSFKVPLRGQDHMACLIPCAIDQDPYFRITRDVAHKLVSKSHPLKGKPALLHSKFFPPLQGACGKMSASDENSAIFLTDTNDMINNKISKYCFSGGRTTAKEQREQGADLEVDVAYQWLRFFLNDDQELDKIASEYGSGQGDYWNTGSVKKRLIQELQKIVSKHKEIRDKITDDDVAEWMAVRQLKF